MSEIGHCGQAWYSVFSNALFHFAVALHSGEPVRRASSSAGSPTPFSLPSRRVLFFFCYRSVWLFPRLGTSGRSRMQDRVCPRLLSTLNMQGNSLTKFCLTLLMGGPFPPAANPPRTASEGLLVKPISPASPLSSVSPISLMSTILIHKPAPLQAESAV